MKGVVFNLLEQVVVREYGENVWDDLLDATGLGGAYTSLGSYPDQEMMSLVSAAATALKLPPNDVGPFAELRATRQTTDLLGGKTLQGRARSTARVGLRTTQPRRRPARAHRS